MPRLRLDWLVGKPEIAVAGVLLAIVVILAGARSVHYLLFHTMAELFAIVVSLCIFVLTWTSSRYLLNGYLIVLGASYGAIGLVDIFHTLTFKGMNLFPGVSTNYPTQFWLTARYLEAIALLCGPLVIARRPNFALVSMGFAAAALVACAAVMLQWFPTTFVDGVGLTPFKVNSEYVIIAMLVAGFILLYRRRRQFESRIFLLLAGSLWLAMATEVCFTRYAGFYDFTNELGHYFRFLSVALAFIAVVFSGVRQPFELIFREMDENKRLLVELNEMLAKSEERYRTAFVTSPDAFTITRVADGQYVDVNDGFIDTFGWARDEVIGRTESQIGIWRNPQDRRRLVDALQTNDYCKNLEVELVTKAGSVITSLVSAHAITIAGDRCLLSVTRDISDLKQAEAALHEADRRKNAFLAMLGHELRNPLAPISNAVEILRHIGLTGVQFSWCRDVIARQTQHLTRLVDDLLDLSRITRGKVELRLERLDVADILDRALETSQPLIDARRHALTVHRPHAPIQVQGDAIRLAQVVSNLLANAAKYTDEGGQIGLTAERDHDEVRIRVCDTGHGLDSAVLPHLFELFYQVDDTLDRAAGGLGIGLSLVKHLVDLHGGTVQVFSEGRGHGSEFVICLPCLPARPASALEDAIAPAPNQGGLCVLIVDDNRDAADSLALLLDAAGDRALTAYDGETALTVAYAERPQVVLLDLGLPGLDGYAVAQRLRQHQQTELPALRLIALTGYGDPESRQRSRAAGFDMHLIKPVDIATLQCLLAEYRNGVA